MFMSEARSSVCAIRRSVRSSCSPASQREREVASATSSSQAPRGPGRSEA